MHIFLTICLIFYVITVMALMGFIFLSLIRRKDEEVETVKLDYQRSLTKNEAMNNDLKDLEAQTNQIFTLYDMTREITKNFNEVDAFRVFQTRLREKISYQECRLLEPLAEEAERYKHNSDYFVFPLTGHKKLLGYLAVQGMTHREKDIFIILVQQFALALRRIRLYQEIERLAIVDSLTGMHTRRYILERFEEEIKRAAVRKGHLSFLMADVDFFKHFNDRYGHLTGDQILREVAKIIRENVREIDIVGRFGGEEFCVVLPDTDLTGANFAAERIRQAVEKSKVKAYDTVVNVTLSIGFTTFPQDGRTISELVENADAALYQAKKAGRNKVCIFALPDNKD